MRALGAQGRCAPSRLTCTSFRDAATAGRAPVGRFEVDVTSHYRTHVGRPGIGTVNMNHWPARTDPEETAIGRPTQTARRLVEASVSENTRRAYAGSMPGWTGASSTM